MPGLNIVMAAFGIAMRFSVHLANGHRHGLGRALLVLAAFLRAVMVCMTPTAVQSGVAFDAMAISFVASNGA